MSFLEAVTGAWGLLPLAVPATVFVALRLGTRIFPDNIAHRAVGGAVLATAIIIGCVRLFGALQIFTPAVAAVTLLLLTVGAYFLRPPPDTRPFRSAIATRETLPLVLLGLVALGTALLAARWLPIWHWDSNGYHLPFVNFFLVAHGPADVPLDLPYVGTYAHNVEYFTIAFRSLLPDDRLVDAPQIALGILGAMSVAGIARLHGVERAHAIAAGCAWLAVPAIFLQLPSNYVDVGSAAFLLAAVYFVLAPTSARTIVLAGIALGLFLGSKPSAPATTAVLGLILVVRGLRAKHARAIIAALALVLVFGAESYVTNMVVHGNPSWPVRVDVGPLHLPGIFRYEQVAPDIPPLGGPLPLRLLRSWTALNSPPIFDMRAGGYGLLFLIALPFAIATLVKRKAWLWALVLVALFLNPYPTWVRFVMAFPGIVLALAAAQLPRVQPHARAIVLGVAAVIAAFQIHYAWPGLAETPPVRNYPYHGPPLSAYAHMTDAERERAVGAAGDPTKFIEARTHVGNGETYAFEGDAELIGLTWERDLRYRVIFVPDDFPADRVGTFLEHERVRVFMAAPNFPMGKWVQANPERVTKLADCNFAPCSIYERH